MSQSKISKIENGRARPSAADVDRIAGALDVRTEIRVALRNDAIANKAKRVQPSAVQRCAFPIQVVTEVTNEVRLIRTVNDSFIDGALQIPEYVAGTHRLCAHRVPLAEYVAARLRRQALTHDGKREHQIIISEHVLTKRMLSIDLQIEQLRSIRRRMLLPGVELGIFPEDELLPTALTGTVATFGNELVARDIGNTGLAVEADQDEARESIAAFQKLAKASIWGADADRLLVRSIENFKRLT